MTMQRVALNRGLVSAPSVTKAAPVGLLQRQCACGGSGSSGECDECEQEETRLPLQRSLAIGASNDPLEQEAERVAEQVLGTPSPAAVTQSPPRIQRLSHGAQAESVAAPASVDRVLLGTGEPLDRTLQTEMSHRFGHDFSRVRIHRDGAAQQSAKDVHANAYTVGPKIVFGAGRYDPVSNAGRKLIAHELTHVVQQSPSGGALSAPPTPGHIQRQAIPFEPFFQPLPIPRIAPIPLPRVGTVPAPPIIA